MTARRLDVPGSARSAKGRLLLFEAVIRQADRLSYSLLSDLSMMLHSGGRERTEAEYRALYKAAGFRLTRVIETPSPTGMAMIEGTPLRGNPARRARRHGPRRDRLINRAIMPAMLLSNWSAIDKGHSISASYS